MIPVYAFLRGDTLGVVVLTEPSETVSVLAKKVQQAARVRVQSSEKVRLSFAGKVVNPNMTVAQAGISALDRVMVETLK